ncbi:MAG: efflux RND transporter permease subunit [Deltaproteobacteria bacterium]|nr:efflux RND transporter permease subunit [Deltaproteobacteria bacterium]
MKPETGDAPSNGTSNGGLASLSIRRPTFITCIVLLMLAVGYLCMQRLGVDLFPDVTFPVVTVTTPYSGAGPTEIETLVSKPLEDEISTISGLKRLSSINQEGISIVVAEFTLETDVKYAEQQIRDRVGAAKRKLPKEIDEPAIRRIDPADQPIIILALHADLPPGKLFDLADDRIRPKIEQVNRVGFVGVIGGRKREIQVQLDRDKLKNREISASLVASRLAATGEDIPLGSVKEDGKEVVYRALGQFSNLDDIERSIVNFFGNDVPVRVRDMGRVVDTLADEKSRSYLNGEQSLFLYVFRQTGANTVAVGDAVHARVDEINRQLTGLEGHPRLEIVRDAASWVRINIEDVKDSILIGILLAVIVVFYFLGSGRSTIITGLAIPNSLLGGFILIAAAGFTINVMTLLALSLSVGLLIDDAIVVRENIFRHMMLGKTPKQAALEGTAEVRMAVIATTLCIIAVFGPIGFLKGVTGQIFKQFGLTVCFVMAISLFDALTIAPMLSAYFAGVGRGAARAAGPRGLFGTILSGISKFWDRTIGRSVRAFERFHVWLENSYVKSLHFTLRRPLVVLAASGLLFLGSCAAVRFVPKTFLPPQDAGEFMVAVDLPPGTNLEAMSDTALKIDAILRSNKEVAISALTVGNREGESNVAEFYVKLIPAGERALNTSGVKEKIRDELKAFARANPKVKDYDMVAAGWRPFNLNIVGTDIKELEKIGYEVFDRVKKHPGLKDVDINYRPGKPEFQVATDKDRASRFGISSRLIGQELRTQVEGAVAAKFREEGREYDVRVRLKEDQRRLKEAFSKTFVPNLNGSLIRVSDVARAVETVGPAKITRQDRGRYVQISADIAPGAGLGNIMNDLTRIFETEYKLPQGMRYVFVGQAENYKELGESVAIAMGLGILFIYLVLASLYESFVVPFTIMLALPLAIVGSFVALFIARQSLNIFSMIGTIMLLGVATKNSILLVDYANRLIREGHDRATALIQSGKIRLRPILMTTMALIAGTSPVAMGLSEASRQRSSMGVAIIGGLISSTLLTLFVVPAAFTYIDRFRLKARSFFGRFKGSVDARR